MIFGDMFFQKCLSLECNSGASLTLCFVDVRLGWVSD